MFGRQFSVLEKDLRWKRAHPANKAVIQPWGAAGTEGSQKHKQMMSNNAQ